MAMERAWRASLERRPDPSAKAPLFEDFATDFLERYAKANNKLSEYQSKADILELHLVPWFAGQRLDEITAEPIEAYKAAKVELGLKPKSINNHTTVLSKMLKLAVEWGRLASAPTIKRLKVTPADFDFF